MKRVYAIRGAVCAKNTAQSIQENVTLMCRTLFQENSLKSEDLISIHFTMTDDLDELNAATALRRGDTGLDTSSVALFTSQEANIKGMLPEVIRVMVTVWLEEGTELRNVYLNGAQALRPDRSK